MTNKDKIEFTTEVFLLVNPMFLLVRGDWFAAIAIACTSSIVYYLVREG